MPMKIKLTRRNAMVVIATIVALALPTLPHPTSLHSQEECYVEQSETPVEQDSCGSVVYDLTFYINYGYGDYSGDAGEYTVNGACYSYTDCNCVYQNGTDPGTINGFSDGGPGLGYIDFYWQAMNVEEYEYSDCSSGQCQNTGVVPEPIYYYDNYIAYETWGC